MEFRIADTFADALARLPGKFGVGVRIYRPRRSTSAATIALPTHGVLDKRAKDIGVVVAPGPDAFVARWPPARIVRKG